MKKIFHWAGFGRNYGDIIMISEQQRLLNEQSKKELLFIPLSSHNLPQQNNTMYEPEITEEIIDYINSGDMLIIGAGGQLMPSERRYGVWQFNIQKAMINKIKVPVVVYGIGINIFKYPGDGSLSPSSETRMAEHVATTCNKAGLVSVRDTEAQKYLKQCGIESELISDPAFGIAEKYKYTYKKEYKKNSKTIGLVWGGDRLEQRYGSKEKALDLMISLSEYIKSCALWDNYEVIYIPHTELWDMEDYHIFKQLFPKDKFTLASGILPEKQDYSALLSWYNECDLIVSSRWHGNIIAQALDIPSFPLGTMYKQKALKNDLLGEATIDEFFSLDKFTLNDTDYLSKNRSFNEKVLEILL